MVNLRLQWLQEPLMFFFFLVLFVLKPWLWAMNFHKGTWKLGENIRCVGGGEIITDIKTRY